MQLKYLIVLKASLGHRLGKMNFDINGSEVSGTIEILGHTEPFSGTIEGSHCSIKGSISTLLRKFDYEAEGEVTEQRLSLHLTGDKFKYEISGKALSAIN